MSDDSLDRAQQIAEAVRDAGGRALIVGGWVRDRLMGRDSKDVDIEVFGVPADRLRRILESLGRVETVGESFQVYKSGDIDVSLPRRESKSGRGHRGFDITGDPGDGARRGRAAARLHGQRDRVGSADRRVPRSVRRPRRHRAAASPRRRSGDVRRRQPARAARRAVRRAIRVRARRRGARDLCRGIPLDDLPAERIWGEIEKLLLAPRPSIGLALAMELGVVGQLFPEAAGARRLSAGAGMAPRGRRVGAHAAGGRSGARSASTISIVRSRSPSCWAPSATTSASRRRPPSSTAASDRWITRNRASRPTQALLDRLNIHSLDGYDVRRQVRRARGAAPQAGRVVQGARRGGRRRVPAARAQGRSRTARARREVRLPGPRARPLRLHGDGLVPRARARARRRASSAGADSARPPPARARPRSQVRASARF